MAKDKTLKRNLDEVYSRWLRKSYADDRGYITCYCGVSVPWEESDCSHFVPRGCLALRFDIRNTRPACRRCNRFMGGNLHAFAIVLEAEYGPGILQELARDKQKITKYFPYEEKIAHYTALLDNILKNPRT